MSPYANRRTALITQMHAKGGGIAIIPTAPEVMRNRDADYPYRHDSYFYYLSGFTEPEAVIVLIAGETNRSILFCREKNMEREIWDGFRYGPDVARTTFGFDAAYPIDSLDTELPRLMANAPALYYALGSDQKLDAQVQRWLQSVRAQARAGITPPNAAFDVHILIDDMRLKKDAVEIDIMQRSADIAAAAHRRAMRIARPGLREYQLEAEILHEFRNSGSQFPAYGSIVATGANACVLHYRASDAELKDGDLVLIDAGCELDSYASDITRTFPASGKFSGPQKELYEIVLASQYAAIAETKPGKRFMDGHDAAVRVLAQGMLDTGLLDSNKVGTLDDVITNRNYSQFYMHRTGHWLGMDVHDVGDYRDAAPAGADRPWRTLEAGMVLTVEPGIYVRPAEGVPEKYWNIGIRIEDDALITIEGVHILSEQAPKTVADIETLMRH
ncbi:MAG: aminopeptidase P N-terminal domain-containing protein [Oxalicibacterium faecigallinarum]|uniref:aminopeptidase P N-terminal domain-containing protein n=1 Tax=Oxalicibacterium faecigallinarum TaxID=573741 RepID=UPI00280720A8|nr:aminopeptidase P N-terminal domain-containing protein [Oxalicibacterium faecigallinarum]MDQ7970308.1 aminopeptidase P N-terminal domain-containing protein [Oxalicibacterium faecigallinarum]